MFARLIATLSGTAPRTPIRNANRFRPQVEGLEARDVPAAFGWTGDYSSDAADWRNWDSVEAPGLLPGPGSDVYFGQNATPDYMTMNRPCVGLGVPGAYHGVYINNKYGQTITLSSGFVTADLIMQASPTGAISQPAAGTDITVTSNFIWTGGTLNSSPHVSAVTLDGANGLIAPRAAGVVSLGSNLSVVNAAVLNLYAGTVACINENISLTLAAQGAVRADPGAGNVLRFRASLNVVGKTQMLVQATAEVELLSGRWEFGGRGFNFGGRVAIHSQTTLEYFDPQGGRYNYVQTDGITQLYGGSKLTTNPFRSIRVAGGKLVTVADGSTASATVQTEVLDIDDGEIVISDGSGYHTFGTLLVDGDVLWTGGTYRPVVLGVENGGSADLWHSTGVFEVGSAVKIAPGSIDYEHSQVPPTESNWTWIVLRSDGGIWDPAGNKLPAVEGYFVLDPVAGNPVTVWKIKSKID